MNFLNFLTSGASLFNFNLQQTRPESVKENTVIVQPKNPKDLTSFLQPKPLEALQQGARCENGGENNEQLSELLKNQHTLISQYIQLNIKYLQTQLNTNGSATNVASNEQEKGTEQEILEKKSIYKKKTKKINKCGHQDKAHYAKGMCNNCYHKYGRNKKPWNCPHTKLYAAGMCQNCYINNYNRKRREEKQQDGEQQENEHQEPIGFEGSSEAELKKFDN